MSTNPVVHIHIPKNGGSTLENLLMRNWGREGVYMAYQHMDGPVEEFRVSPKRSEARAVSGHFDLTQALTCTPAGSRLFTMLRNPVDRVLSSYYMFLHHENHPLGFRIRQEGISLEQYADPRYGFNADNVQTKYLSGLNRSLPSTPRHLEYAKSSLAKALCTFGLLEYYKESIFLMAERLGFNTMEYKHVGKNNKKPLRDELDDRTLRTIRMFNIHDMELYSHALMIFKNRLKSLQRRRPEEFEDYMDWTPEVQACSHRHSFRDDAGRVKPEVRL